MAQTHCRQSALTARGKPRARLLLNGACAVVAALLLIGSPAAYRQ